MSNIDKSRTTTNPASRALLKLATYHEGHHDMFLFPLAAVLKFFTTTGKYVNTISFF